MKTSPSLKTRSRVRVNKMAAEMTTIQISVDLKARLEALKDHPRQSYNEVILRLVEEQTGVVENRKED